MKYSLRLILYQLQVFSPNTIPDLELKALDAINHISTENINFFPQRVLDKKFIGKGMYDIKDWISLLDSVLNTLLECI